MTTTTATRTPEMCIFKRFAFGSLRFDDGNGNYNVNVKKQ